MSTANLFDSAIAALEKISASLDTDDATAEEANRQIAVLRSKKQDAAFDSIVSRTGDVQTCMDGLQSVIDKAKFGGVGDKINDLTALVAQGRGILDQFNGK